MINRIIADSLRKAATEYPVVAITGPRQTGKTTLARACFPDKKYVNLEEPDQRALAGQDPRRFLSRLLAPGAIIDEIQHVPQLFSYLQPLIDADRRPGMFVLTGSQHFGLLQGISQSLAGRVALFSLSPFSMEELNRSNQSLNQLLFEGAFPPVLVPPSPEPGNWYRNYVATYLERDVRTVTNVSSLSVFHRFLRLCAANVGQLVNFSNMGRDLGVSYNTVRAWISILETSGLVFLLQPYHTNFTKRLVKAPKLYFCDTGLVCALLGIETPDQLDVHRMRGEIFECWVISELMKIRLNAARNPNLFFWRDYQGHEVDLVIERPAGEALVEVKSGATVASEFFRGIEYWKTNAVAPETPAFLIYGGDEDENRAAATIVSWRRLAPALKSHLLGA